MSISIRRRNGEVIIEGGFDSISSAIAKAIADGLELYGANLSRADLSGANLSGANLSGANLSGADLSRADLSGANLSGADLYGADLYGANLSRADLSGANLSGANLSGADLSGANLSRADLSGADLSGAKNGELALAMTRILPDGEIIGWKKCAENILVKLAIPADAKRSHAFGRKCRAESARVLEIIGAEKAVSLHDPRFIYTGRLRGTADRAVRHQLGRRVLDGASTSSSRARKPKTTSTKKEPRRSREGCTAG